jgi:hypothetical protein
MQAAFIYKQNYFSRKDAKAPRKTRNTFATEFTEYTEVSGAFSFFALLREFRFFDINQPDSKSWGLIEDNVAVIEGASIGNHLFSYLDCDAGNPADGNIFTPELIDLTGCRLSSTLPVLPHPVPPSAR